MVWYLVLGPNLPGDRWLSASYATRPELGSVSPFFLRCAALLHHLGFIHIALSLASAYLFMQKPNGSRGLSLSGGPAGLAGVPSAGSLQRGCWAVIRAAPDKSRAGIFLWRVLDRVKAAPGGGRRASWQQGACRPRV